MPRLEVTESGRLRDQFYHTRIGSHTAGILRSRSFTKKQKSHDSGGLRPRSNTSVEVFTDSEISHAGYLVKQGSFWKTWRRRYFILRKDQPVLSYYSSIDNLKKLGEVTLNEDTIFSKVPTNDRPWQFSIQTNSRVLLLDPGTGGTQCLNGWEAAIRKCIDRFQDTFAYVNASPFRCSIESFYDGLETVPALGASFLDLGTSNKQNGHSFTSHKSTSPPVQLNTTQSESVMKVVTNEENLDAFSVALTNENKFADEGHKLYKEKSTVDTDLEKFENLSIDIINKEKGQNIRKISSEKWKETGSSEFLLGGSVIDIPRRNSEYSLGSHSLQNYHFEERYQEMVKQTHRRSTVAKSSISHNLSLVHLQPQEKLCFSVSYGSLQNVPQTKNSIVVSASEACMDGSINELSRTEVVSADVQRTWSDIHIRDSCSLLSIPFSSAEMIHLEVHGVKNMATEILSNQESLGFARISTNDILKSKASGLIIPLRGKVGKSNENASTKNFTRHNKCSDGLVKVGFLFIEIIDVGIPLRLGNTFSFARQYFIAESTSRGFQEQLLENYKTNLVDCSAAYKCHESRQNSMPLLVTEELSAIQSSLSVVISFLRMLQQRNSKLIDRLQEQETRILNNTCSNTGNRVRHASDTSCSPPESKIPSIHHSSSLGSSGEDLKSSSLSLSRQMYEEYDSYLDYYNALHGLLLEGKEPGITACLKRSTQKKDKNAKFMPTNLVCHFLQVNKASEKTNISMASNESLCGFQMNLTHGCPAAHIEGFKEGGLRRIRRCINNTNALNPSFNKKLIFDQLFRIMKRQDIVYCQMLGIVTAAILSVVGLAAQGSIYHRNLLEIYSKIGFLLSVESLLTTMGSEMGMLEDMDDSIKWLDKCVSFQFVHLVSKKKKAPYQDLSYDDARCVSISSTSFSESSPSIENGEDQWELPIIVTVALPDVQYQILPNLMKEAGSVKVTAVLFTQGINEMQSVANSVMDTSLQEEINYESIQVLKKYFKDYSSEIRSRNVIDEEMSQNGSALSNLEDTLLRLQEERNSSARRGYVQRKNVNILISSSDLCRKLGAVRTTCCKSGKDRTAMSITLESSRFLVEKCQVKQGVKLCTAMRERGVRRTNVVVNTGKSCYAFNSLQLKYLPDCYRPPPHTTNHRVVS